MNPTMPFCVPKFTYCTTNYWVREIEGVIEGQDISNRLLIIHHPCKSHPNMEHTKGPNYCFVGHHTTTRGFGNDRGWQTCNADTVRAIPGIQAYAKLLSMVPATVTRLKITWLKT